MAYPYLGQHEASAGQHEASADLPGPTRTRLTRARAKGDRIIQETSTFIAVQDQCTGKVMEISKEFPGLVLTRGGQFQMNRCTGQRQDGGPGGHGEAEPGDHGDGEADGEVSCVEGEIRCSGDVRQVCQRPGGHRSAPTWITVEDCPAGCADGDCLPDEPLPFHEAPPPAPALCDAPRFPVLAQDEEWRVVDLAQCLWQVERTRQANGWVETLVGPIYEGEITYVTVPPAVSAPFPIPGSTPLPGLPGAPPRAPARRPDDGEPLGEEVWMDRLRQWAAENPWLALAAAGGVGFAGVAVYKRGRKGGRR